MNESISFESEAVPSSHVAQMKCALRTSPSLRKMVQQRLRFANVLWPAVCGAMVIGTLLALRVPAVNAVVMGAISIAFCVLLLHIPFLARKNRQNYEKQIIKNITRLAQDNSAFKGPWRFTVSREAVEYENLTNGSAVRTALRSIERAYRIDGHLCIIVDGEVNGSLPLEAIQTEQQLDDLRQLLCDAGIKGWPQGEYGLPERPGA